MKLTSLVMMLLIAFSAAAQEEFFDDVYFSSSKKEKKDKSKEAENCIYSGWTPAERNLFYRKISARFFQKKSKTDIWYCWCTYAYPRI